MKKNFDLFIACLKELPDTNASGMLLRVNGLDVQGSLLSRAACFGMWMESRLMVRSPV